MYSTAVILILEPCLWIDNWLDQSFRVRVPGSVAFSLLLILPFNAWLLDRFLSSKTPGDGTLPKWLHGLRLLALSPPLFSFHTISLWKKLLERRAPAERPAYSHALSLDLSRRRQRLAPRLQLRVLYRSGFLFVWMAVSLLPVGVWALWLAGATWLGAWHRPLLLGVFALLHLATCLSMALHFQLEIQKSSVRGWRKALLLTSSLLWLFAIPGMLLGFAFYLLAKPSEGSLSWKIHASRTGVDRDPLWRGIEGRLQQRWGGQPWFTQWRRPTGLSRSGGQGRQGAEIIAFFRLKTLLLAFESISFTVLLLSVPSLRPALDTGIRAAVWIAWALAGTGSMIQITMLLARLCRISRLVEILSRHPYGRYLLLTQMAFLTGTYGGGALMQVSIEQLGFLLGLSMILCIMICVFFFLPFLPHDASSKGPDMGLWILLYLALSALGVLIAFEGEAWRSNLLSFFRTSAALSPFWSIGLFIALGGWLLRPFSWRHVFERRLPRRFRAALAFMIVTATLPLGGVMIPFWIYARHRLWPRYEPLLSSPAR